MYSHLINNKQMEFAWTTLPALVLLQISIAYFRDHENIAFASFIINTETQGKTTWQQYYEFLFYFRQFSKA